MVFSGFLGPETAATSEGLFGSLAKPRPADAEGHRGQRTRDERHGDALAEIVDSAARADELTVQGGERAVLMVTIPLAEPESRTNRALRATARARLGRGSHGVGGANDGGLTRAENSVTIDSMNIEWNDDLRERAQVHAALGEPARLAIVDRLVLGDASPAELGRELALPSNLLAHHVKLLAQAGVLERSRSEGDRRRTYLRLRTEALTGLVPASLRTAPRLVFVCTQNSARSQLAAALWERRSHVPATSAGTRPAARVHPGAMAVARSHGLTLPATRTAHVEDVLREGDLVIAVCDNAHEELGDRAVGRLHWSVADPARAGTDDAFERAFRDLADRIVRLAPAIHAPGDDHD